MPETCSSRPWSLLRLRMSSQDTREVGPSLWLTCSLTIPLHLKGHHMEHHNQYQCLPTFTDHHQTLAHLPTLCRTNGLPTNLLFTIVWINHQHIIPLIISHSIMGHMDHLHHPHRNNSATHLLDQETSQRTVLLPRLIPPQAATTHKTNYLLRLQPRLIISRKCHNYRL